MADFAEERRATTELLSFFYLRYLDLNAAPEELQAVADLLLDCRNEFAAIWDVLPPDERDQIGLPNIEQTVTLLCVRERGEVDGQEHAQTLLANRVVLEYLRRSFA